jgi:hypothetical protein
MAGPLQRHYDSPPIVLASVLNSYEDSPADARPTDTYIATALNITTRGFEVCGLVCVCVRACEQSDRDF